MKRMMIFAHAKVAKTTITLLGTALSISANAGTELKLLKGTISTANWTQSQLVTSADFRQQAIGDVREMIVQFKSAVTEADKNMVRNLGGQVFRYLPEDALLVKLTSAQTRVLLNSKKVQAILPYQVAYKVSPHFSSFSVFSNDRMVNVLVSCLSAQDAKNVGQALAGLDANHRILNLDGRYLTVQMTESKINQVAGQPGIEFVEPVNEMVPLHMQLEAIATEAAQPAEGDYKDLTGFETGTKVMNFDAAWAQGFRGEGQIASMADTGLDSGFADSIHADFKGAVTKGYSFGAGAKTWDDPMGHGTHVAGSVLGRGVASGGLLLGGAHRAQFVPQGMWSPIVDNLTVPAKLNKLFDAAYADGARIHTNSWGAARSFGAYDGMAQQVDEFMWNHPDFLILFAAGNSGVDMNKDGVIDANSIGSPGTAKGALTVGASENVLAVGGIQRKVSELRTAKDSWPAEPIWSSRLSDNADGIAMFSSRGPCQDGRTKPEIMAPGTNILSVKSSLLKPEDNFWGAYSKDYIYSGGTSMATPLVAGAATVTREVLVKRFKFPNPSAALVKAVLLHTAHDMYPGQYGLGQGQEIAKVRPNSDEGYGRTDMAAVVGLSEATKMLDSEGVAQGESAGYSVEIKEGGSLLVNMVYTDAPGTPSAGTALVNDLDLEVKTPAGELVSMNDHVNPHEIIELKNLKSGVYQVAVKGNKIPMGKAGKQPFALISTVR